MRLEELRAIPHPDGHRIDVRWVNPDPVRFPGMRLVRREGTHPVTPDDGAVILHAMLDPVATDEDGRPVHRVQDLGLKGNTVYYYGLFPYHGEPPDFSVDRANRVVALATGRHDGAGRMYDLLPAIYRRYDAEGGRLREFLTLPGGQLDLLHAFARSVLDFHDLDRVDGELLPLLASWIGWKTDFRLEIERQRSEVREAPALYRRVGLIPVVGATVKRISGWESRSKEFVHNVLRSNRPPRLNLWARRLAEDGSTVLPAWPPDAPPDAGADVILSLDFAYEGRATVATDDHGIRWVFYPARRRDGWRIRYKTAPTFRLTPDARTSLAAADIVALQEAFAAVGIDIAADAAVTPAGTLWHVEDATNGQTYVVEPDADGLTVYHTSAEPLAAPAMTERLSPSLAPSRLLEGDGGSADERDPAAALQTDTLWLFWTAYDRAAERWEIHYRTRRDGTWSEARHRLWETDTDPVPERRRPAAMVDQDDGLWLFWLEKIRGRWFLRYNRHDGTGLDTDPAAGWGSPADFPLDGGDAPRVEGDPFVLFHPDDASRRIWVFWARRDGTPEPAQTRWAIAYRVKAGIDPAASDWSAIETLPRPDPFAHDREPAARVDADGNVALFWSSDRDGGWSIWRGTLDVGTASWVDVERVTSSPYAQRDPLPVPLDDGTLLVYRSSESLRYGSDVYRATRTVDFRYAGSTSAHVRDAAKLALRGEFEDFQRYTFDTGSGEGDWYRRDTIGVYLSPDTLDEGRVRRGVERLASVLPEFMPATDRAVFISGRNLQVEHVYTYDTPGLEPRFITESYGDALTLPVDEPVLEDSDFSDDLE